MLTHGEFLFSTEASGVPGIQRLVFGPRRMQRMREYAGPGGRLRGPLERTIVRTEGGALIDSMLRYEVIAAFVDLVLARANRDPVCLEVEMHIREIVQGSLPHVAN